VALLKLQHLSVSFAGQGRTVQAVRDVSLSVHHGETFCLVGESGSGKSLTARAVMGLLPEAATLTGTIRFDGDVLTSDQALHRGHRHCGRVMAMVFQEPKACLNPTMKVEDLVGEAFRIRFSASRAQGREKVREALVQAGLQNPDEYLQAYPWQLSGGLAQRVMIASALIAQARLLIADEPTTALDVTTQAQILKLLARLRESRGLAMLFITHDLALAGLMGGQCAVMRRGAVVESGPTRSVLESPHHPFTRALIASTPAHALRTGGTRLSPAPAPRPLRQGPEERPS